MQAVAFPRSPGWFLGGVLLLGVAVAVLCGGKAVYRMHSLTVLGVGIAMAIVAILGLKYAEPAYLTPWLGKGADQVFGRGLSTLFLYTDSILVLQLASRCRGEVRVGRTGFLGAVLAVLLNVALVLVSSMSHSSALSGVSNNLIYPLTKAAYFGRFWSRMDAIYLLALMTSAFLYLSMAIHLFFLAIKGVTWIPRPGKRTAALCLVGILCVSLTGCYDGREVEAAAYTIALGIDQGETQRYRYTFQLSNPLELGGSMETENTKTESQGEEESAQENKTVSNISIEAEDFYLAVNQLKSHLSKEPDFSHLKLLVFSYDAAKAGVLEHASLLFWEQEVRPSTNVCLAESAGKFLKEVKPTLEQSTARYYELLFQNRNTPYAPVVELREFVSRGTDGGWDPVLPIATAEKLTGIGVFQEGKLVATMDGKAAMLYRFLTGDATEIAVRAGNSSFSVASRKKPEFHVDANTSPKRIGVRTYLTAELVSGSKEDFPVLTAQLEDEMTAFLRETFRLKADVLGVGAWMRYGMLQEGEWGNANWREEMPKFDIFSQTRVKE
ncbi:MAG: GerAB/ArcD/ProY family transporter [Clostridia bacterium]|nr:GerAB/ArcD/ProY family transporter [Clostridia bacterium]